MVVAIDAQNIHKTFGNVQALKGVDLIAEQGKILGLLGPNGAGKTTLVRILTTLMKPDKGSAQVVGINVLQNPDQARQIIGLAGQYPAVDEMLTGRENLVMVGRLYHFRRSEARRRADELLQQFALVDAADRPVRTYSGGMRRRLDLAASIVARPPVLFLDEPTSGLDPRTRIELWDTIRELVSAGTTLLLTTQYLEEADELADRIVVIDEGQVIAEGKPEELKARLQRDVLQLRVANLDELTRAYAALQVIGNGKTQVAETTGTITLPVGNGAQSLIESVRILDEANIAIADISLRRPSLDDVFLALTDKTNGR